MVKKTLSSRAKASLAHKRERCGGSENQALTPTPIGHDTPVPPSAQ
jgi:hypothetical protein